MLHRAAVSVSLGEDERDNTTFASLIPGDVEKDRSVGHRVKNVGKTWR